MAEINKVAFFTIPQRVWRDGRGVDKVSKAREGVIWIREMLPREDVIQFYSHASVFSCPSVYEPFGIINLGAMACETAVVASAIGGIPEVVVPENSGVLVDLELKPGMFDPVDPAMFSADLAAGINRVALDPGLRESFGQKAAAGWMTISVGRPS